MLDMTNTENNDQWRQIGYRDDLSTSLEDYLEAIYAIILDQSAVRVKDIARRLEVKNSSVTSALKALTAKKLINHEPYGIITLTQEGNKVARRIYEKHKIVEGFLIKVLGVNPEEAGVWACRIEHVISPDILKRLLTLTKYIYDFSEVGKQWSGRFEQYCKKELINLNCMECFDSCYQYYKKIEF